MMICSHCGRPWNAEACRLPGKPIKRELASKAPQTLLQEEKDDNKGRDPNVISR